MKKKRWRLRRRSVVRGRRGDEKRVLIDAGIIICPHAYLLYVCIKIALQL